jgi:hypothetical protein
VRRGGDEGAVGAVGSWEWLEDLGLSIPPEITNITGITDEMVTGHRIDDRAVDDLTSTTAATSFGPRGNKRAGTPN